MSSVYESQHLSPPGPQGFSSVQTLLGLSRDPFPLLFKLTEQYGDIIHIGLPTYHLYIVNHPDYLYELLVKQADKVRKPKALSRPIAELLGGGLLVSEGEIWRQQRRLIQPAFHHRRVEGYGRTMAVCIREVMDDWEAGCIYDIDREMMRMTLPMVTRNLFGSDVSYAVDEIAEAVSFIQMISYRQGQSPLPLPRWIPIPNHIRKRQAMGRLDMIVLKIVEAYRAATTENDHLLAMLMDSVDEDGKRLSDQQVRDEVMTVLLAGHESTANALTWMCSLLAQHPVVQEKLQAELDAVLNGYPPTVSDLKALPYNYAIVQEALRLYPPAWALPREPLEDIVIGGYTIPKGSLVVGLPYLIQRDARFYDEPECFIPERFEEGRGNKAPLYAYLPFGGGPRFCVGSSFAWTAMQLILATMQQRYTFELMPSQSLETDPLLTLCPKHGMMMRVMARS